MMSGKEVKNLSPHMIQSKQFKNRAGYERLFKYIELKTMYFKRVKNFCTATN